MNEDNANLNVDENESKNKIMLFNFISNIIGEEIIPFPFRFVFYIIEIFQVLSLAFYTSVKLSLPFEDFLIFTHFLIKKLLPFWKNESVSSQFGSFFSYFTIVNHLSALDYYYVIVIFYIVIGFLIFIMFVCLIINVMLINTNKHNLETSHVMFVIFRVYFELLQIIFLPIIELFFFLFKCKEDSAGFIIHEIFHDVNCFTGTNLVHIFVSILAIVMFVSSSIFLVKFCYEIRNKSQSWIAK